MEQVPPTNTPLPGVDLRQPRAAQALCEGISASCAAGLLIRREQAPLMLLLMLGVTRQPMNFGTVAARLQMEKYQVSRLCERMERELLVRREVEPTDGRLRRVHILEKGLALVETLVQPLRLLIA